MGIAHIIFLNLEDQVKVCSATGVLRPGNFSFHGSGLYFSMHCGFLWFRMCRLSMIFDIFSHIWLYGWGRGRGFCEAFKRHRLHMLSYDNMKFSYSDSGTSFSLSKRNLMVKTNTCPGPSDLSRQKKHYHISSTIVLYGWCKCIVVWHSVAVVWCSVSIILLTHYHPPLTRCWSTDCLYVIEDFTVIKYICQGNIQKYNLHIQWIPLINMATPTDKVEQSTGPLPQNFLLLPCVFVAMQVGASVQALLAVRKNTAMLLQKFWSSCNTYHTLLLKASQSGSFSVKPSIHEMHFSDMFINQYIQ